MKLLKLIQNELVKLFAKKKIYIFMGIIFVMTLLLAFIYKFANIDKTMSAQMFPLEILTMQLDMLLPIFISILIADIITDEYRTGTLKLPLIHPVSRKKLLNSKLFVLVITISFLLLFSLIISYGLGMSLFAWEEGFSFNETIYTANQGIFITIGSYIISILPLLTFSLLIMLISLKLSSSGAVVGSAIGLLFGFDILIQLSEVVRPYILNYYFRYYSILINKGIGEESIIGFLVIILYGTVAYLLAVKIFQEKDIVY